MRGSYLLGVAAGLALLGCTPEPSARPDGDTSSSPTATVAASPPETTETAAPALQPVRFEAARATADVRHLAGRIGPRLATAPAYDRAARWVARRLRSLGYDVSRPSFPVPAGDSWGVPVAAGRSSNVVAAPAGFDPSRPHRLVGAHLDTVAVAPGAEDNASGVAVMLELARLAAREEPGAPTVFVAFGAEEPRGPGDALHHFGSTRYVRTMPRAQRRALVAMASLDRVGVGRTVPVCTGPLSADRVQRAVLRTARRIGVPAASCENTASDHWSFEKAGYPVVRFGSTPYAGYHSAGDVPAVVSTAQLGRTGRLAWAWLRTGTPAR
jgi:aminopeptidase S